MAAYPAVRTVNTMLTPKVICLCQTTAHPVGQRPLAAIAGGARTAGFR